jgi:predicted nucleic acid-binding protein
MRRGVLWDSSAILALLDADDADHERARLVAKRLAAGRWRSFVTNYVHVEAHALLLHKLGRSVAREWLLAGGLPVVRAAPGDEERGREIVGRYVDKNWSLCDAISFAVMERHRVRTAFSFDRHFLQYGRFSVLGLDRES